MIEETAFPDLLVIPIDFSPASLNACYYSMELALKFRARVKLLHAYPSPAGNQALFNEIDLPPIIPVSSMNEVRENAEKKMTLFLKKVRSIPNAEKFSAIPVTTQVIEGLPDEIILYTIQSEKAGLIVMGISCKEIRTFDPLGKTASHIVKKSTIPVLIIPEDMKYKGFEKLKNVLYTTAFDESDFKAIVKLISMIRQFDMNIFCLHIDNEDKGQDQWDKIKMEGLREYVSKVYGKTNVECELMFSNDMINALDRFITLKKIDLISITTRKRTIISRLINQDITKKIIYQTRIPLLVFHG
jgi:nucleotide-binding universal stress UspA family protein